jgi:gluconolactonase
MVRPFHRVTKKMMYLETPPRLIETQIFSAVPAEFRRNVRSDWADANRPGAPTDCFIEGPSFDAEGNLYIVDIPFGRIFRISPDRKWTLVVEYDGWPNGLKIDAKGRILVADYMHGIMECDAQAGQNAADPHRAQFGVVQGLQRPAHRRERRHLFHRPGPDRPARSDGRVYRLRTSGELNCLINTGISPNGLVLDPSESVLFVAMTRDNAVWRAPFMKDGSVSKVGRFCSMFGPSGPDGMTMDSAGRLFVGHASLGHVFVSPRMAR